jgi:hypothetical protein
MSWSNCIIFAWMLWLRRRRKGDAGYVAFRESHWGKFPHAVYVHHRTAHCKEHWVAFVPTSPKRRMIPPPLFKGKVKWGD